LDNPVSNKPVAAQIISNSAKNTHLEQKIALLKKGLHTDAYTQICNRFKINMNPLRENFVAMT